MSFFSTSSELSNKQRFEYFLRTVPSDKSQAQAIVEIVKQFSWTYVSIIYEESIYGIRVRVQTWTGGWGLDGTRIALFPIAQLS